jgi:hypothetical protein
MPRAVDRPVAADRLIPVDRPAAADPPAAEHERPHLLDPDSLGRHIDQLFRAAWALCGSRDDAEDLSSSRMAAITARGTVPLVRAGPRAAWSG